MTDLQNLTDEQLRTLHQQKQAQSQSPLASLSDDELKQLQFKAKAERFKQPTNQAPAFEAFRQRNPVASKAATFLRGLPFAGEFVDEGLGKVGAAIGPNDQQAATDAIRAMVTGKERENPKTALALKLAGGLAGTGLALAAAGPTIAANAPASSGGRIAAGGGFGTVAGGLEGLVSGFGAGEGEVSLTNKERISKAFERGTVGAGIGGGMGLAFPIVAKGAETLARPIIRALMQGNAAKRTGLSEGARNAVVRALNADDSSSTGAANIRRAGAGAMLADAGPNARVLLDTSIQRSGKAATIGREAIEQRAVSDVNAYGTN